MACRGWNVGGTSEYAHAQTPRARLLNTPTTASGRRAESNAITFPTGLTPRSVRLALRKNDSCGSRRILAARNAARPSPSTVRRSRWRWRPKNAVPTYASLSAHRRNRPDAARGCISRREEGRTNRIGVRAGRLRSPRRRTTALRPARHDSGLRGISDPEPVACRDDPALRTSHRGSDQTQEARSVRDGEGETPRRVQVVARRDELSGPQTSAYASHVPASHRPGRAEQVGVPCTHGCDPAGDEADPAPRAEGLATRPDGRDRQTHLPIPMPRERSVFSMLLWPSFSSSSRARIASTFSGTTSDSWWTAWK